ncbi:MAG: hypothetical protein WCL54_00840, partial [Clostridia bacterium]
LAKITEALPRKMLRVTLAIPFTDGAIHSFVHTHGNVISEEYTDMGYEIVAEMPFDKHATIIPFLK